MVRYKCRYILCKIVTDGRKQTKDFSEGDIVTTLRKEINTLHGDYAMASLRNTPAFGVRYLDSKSRMFMIRCQRSYIKFVQSSITFIKKIGNQDAFLQTMHVGGTIRSTMKYLIRYHKSQLPELLMKCKTEEEKKQVQASIVLSCKRSTMMLSTLEKREKPSNSKKDSGFKQDNSTAPNT